jgi:23S rRNA pseudouridine1911/1915/1917 synthase
VGDSVYGHRHASLPLKRHFLHAASLTIQLPGETKEQTFTAPLPEELETILAELRSRHAAG